MLVSHSERAIDDRQASAHGLQTAMLPLFGIKWSAPVLQQVGSRRLNKRRAYATDSELSTGNYNSIASLLKGGLGGNSFPRPSGAPGVSCQEDAPVDGEYQIPLLMPAVRWCVLQGWPDPFCSQIYAPRKSKWRRQFRFPHEIDIGIWKASVLTFPAPADSYEMFRRGIANDAEALLSQVTTSSAIASKTSASLQLPTFENPICPVLGNSAHFRR